MFEDRQSCAHRPPGEGEGAWNQLQLLELGPFQDATVHWCTTWEGDSILYMYAVLFRPAVALHRSPLVNGIYLSKESP